MGPKISKRIIVIRGPSRGRNRVVFDNTPLTAGQKGVALGSPVLKVCSLGACSYVLWAPSSTWPGVSVVQQFIDYCTDPPCSAGR